MDSNMWKLLVIASCCGLAACYDDVDNNFDYDGMENNVTALRIHLDCFVDKGPCDDVALHYKDHILDAVTNACAKCSDIHKHKAHAFLRGLIRNLPQGYAELRRFYDPNDTKFTAMEAELDKY